MDSTRPWTILSDETVFEAAPYVRVARHRVRIEPGREVPDYYQVILPDFAMIGAVTTEGKIITLWQYKHGARQYGLTFPAGIIDEGETAAAAAGRELLEETGYRAASLRFLGRYASSGNQGCGFASFFWAEGCERVADPASGDLERMDLRLMTAGDVEEALRSGDGSSMANAALWGLVRANGLATV